MSIRQLQAMRGVSPPARAEDLHEQQLEAYGYRQLADGLLALPRIVLHAFSAWIRSVPDMAVGPRGCAASVAPGADLHLLIDAIGDDVEIWTSPAAKDATDARRLLLIFGEDHYDPAVLRLGARLMSAFRPERGDRFFMEGAEDWICAERMQAYRMPPDSCRLLEKDSEIDEHFRTAEAQLDRRLRDCLAFLHTQVPGAEPPPNVNDDPAVEAYLKHRLPRLPQAARREFARLERRFVEARRRFMRLFEDTMPQRDQHIAEVLKRDMGPGWNFAIVGANHLRGLREHLSMLPCVFMVPRMIVASQPSISVRSPDKDEL